MLLLLEAKPTSSKDYHLLLLSARVLLPLVSFSVSVCQVSSGLSRYHPQLLMTCPIQSNTISSILTLFICIHIDIEGMVDSAQDGDANDDSYDSVTCYCHKPFAGRPMIECSRCLTWVHLSCARIRRTHIPDVFYCAVCKSEKHSKGRGSKNNDQISRPPGIYEIFN